MIRVLRINLIKESKVKAFVDVEINDLRVNGLKVIDGREGLYVTYPDEKRKNGEYADIVSPITQMIEEAIETAVLTAYKEREGSSERVHTITQDDLDKEEKIRQEEIRNKETVDFERLKESEGEKIV
jgi:stage V sporulation protein G